MVCEFEGNQLVYLVAGCQCSVNGLGAPQTELREIYATPGGGVKLTWETCVRGVVNTCGRNGGSIRVL